MNCVVNENGKVELSPERYVELLKDEKLMRKLEAAGVDNWEGFPPLDSYYKWCDKLNQKYGLKSGDEEPDEEDD